MTARLEEAIREHMITRGLKLATAESCTGGLVSDRITNVSGSSEYFPGGIVPIPMKPKPVYLVYRGTH